VHRQKGVEIFFKSQEAHLEKKGANDGVWWEKKADQVRQQEGFESLLLMYESAAGKRAH